MQFVLPQAFADALFWIAVVACAVAQLFILRAVFRTLPVVNADAGAHHGERGIPVPHRLSEIAWAVLPAFLLAAAFVGAWRVMHPVAS